VKKVSRARGSSFRDTLNDLLRSALLSRQSQKQRRFKVKASAMGLREGLSYDDIDTLVEHSEGPLHL